MFVTSKIVITRGYCVTQMLKEAFEVIYADSKTRYLDVRSSRNLMILEANTWEKVRQEELCLS